MTNTIKAGQRWISNSESELGLGMVLDVEHNRVTVLYMATGQQRIYAMNNAPLTRVEFNPGDKITSEDGWSMTVERVEEIDGLLLYHGLDEAGQRQIIEEMELDHHIQFNKPEDRLFTGQFDPGKWFELRYQTLKRQQQWQQSPVKGLLGSRTLLIPHQLYIAHHAANRPQPRIMLADEVGLGKTIEAGMIIQYRLLNQLSKRVLIMVPDSLVHQWLVEMYRRFNLQFSLFDEERCLSIDEGNPFQSEQLVMCTQSLFQDEPARQQQLLDAGWDLVVVDEAHHLAWDEASPSEEYLLLEHLAVKTPGIILLTATPEQLGKQSHFARLRLLDADRFYSFDAFVKEEASFQPVAELAALLIDGEPLDNEHKQILLQALQREDASERVAQLDQSDHEHAARDELIQLLLDHHGTGRILFRNSRQTVKGFPQRVSHAYPLNANKEDVSPYWTWLVEFLNSKAEDKILLICNQPETVIQLENWLKNRQGIAAAMFHEGMSIVERDRAAAYFADEESSARLLICSEIGSEGRNFQFLHHLVLFDLPENPDLLQQRIGRLDRIGQQHTVEIHVPYLPESRQHVLFRWYEEGMNAFVHNVSSAGQLAEKLSDFVQAVLNNFDAHQLQSLIEETQQLKHELEGAFLKGRDKLLELNSCRPEQASLFVDEIKNHEQYSALWDYMEDIYDCYGVDVEYHSEHCHILRPSENLRIAHFPMLRDEGLTVTTRREIALAREDMQFLTDDHPMVTASMDLVLSSETGNAAVSVAKHPQMKAGQFLLELVYVVECSAPGYLQLGRFLPPTPIRVLMDQQHNNLAQDMPHESLQESGANFDKSRISGFLHSQKEYLMTLMSSAGEQAEQEMKGRVASAEKTMHAELTQELYRLQQLQKINPLIKDEEIEIQQCLIKRSSDAIKEARLKLDAIRFIILA